MRTLLDLVEEGKDLREQKAEIHPLRKAESERLSVNGRRGFYCPPGT